MIMAIWRYPHFQTVPFVASVSVLIHGGQIKFEPYMYALIASGWKNPSQVQPNSCEQGFPAVNDPKLGANVALSLCQWASTLRESTCFSCERSYSNHVTSMQSACIMLGAVAVTLLKQTKQILQLSAQQRVPDCKSQDKVSVAMLPQNMSGVSYVADHSMRQLLLQAVTQWDSQ